MAATPRSVRIRTAQPIGDRVVEPVTIELLEPWPDYRQSIEASGSLDDLRRAFAEEASALADVLCKTLPGGTLDALTAELMRRHASLFVVPKYDDKANGR